MIRFRPLFQAVNDFIRVKGAANHSYPFLSKKLHESLMSLDGATVDGERSRFLVMIIAYAVMCWEYIRKAEK